MISLVIAAVILVTATSTTADIAHLGNNYAVPAEISNELQQTYILPASKNQREYVALPVSVVNTYKATKVNDLSKNIYLPPASQDVKKSAALNAASSQIQLPASTSSLLEKVTQKTIQNTVQKIIQKTVVPASGLSSNLYLPPVEKTKVSHEHLPEIIDHPPKAQTPVAASKTIVTPSPPKVASVNVRQPELIGIRIDATAQTQVNKEIVKNNEVNLVQASTNTVLSSSTQGTVTQVSPLATISSSSQQKAVNSAVKPSKVTDIRLSDIIHSSTPEKVIEKSINSTPKTSDVKPPTRITTSVPSVTIQKTLNVLPEPLKVISGTKTNLAEVKTTTELPSKTVQKTVSIVPEPVKVTQITEISAIKPANLESRIESPISSSSKETKPATVNNVTPSSPTSSAAKVSKGGGISSIAPATSSAPVKVSVQDTKTNSQVETKSTEVKKVATSTPALVFSQRIDASTEKAISKPTQLVKPTSPPATIRSPPSLWGLPKVIDIVQKTIKSSVNSNLKPIKDGDLEIATIFPGLSNGPENHYLPPDEKEIYENVEVFTPEGYKTERRLKTIS